MQWLQSGSFDQALEKFYMDCGLRLGYPSWASSLRGRLAGGVTKPASDSWSKTWVEKVDQMKPNESGFRWGSLEQVLNQLLMVWKPQFICIYIYIYILSNYTYVYIHVITLGTGWNMLWIIDAKTFPYNSVGQVIRIDNITQHHGFNQNMAYIAKKRWEKPMRSTPCRHDKRI